MFGLGLSIPQVATRASGVAAAAYASFPAPTGFRWDFLTSAGQRVTVSGRPVVVLVGA